MDDIANERCAPYYLRSEDGMEIFSWYLKVSFQTMTNDVYVHTHVFSLKKMN